MWNDVLSERFNTVASGQYKENRESVQELDDILLARRCAVPRRNIINQLYPDETGSTQMRHDYTEILQYIATADNPNSGPCRLIPGASFFMCFKIVLLPIPFQSLKHVWHAALQWFRPATCTQTNIAHLFQVLRVSFGLELGRSPNARSPCQLFRPIGNHGICLKPNHYVQVLFHRIADRYVAHRQEHKSTAKSLNLFALDMCCHFSYTAGLSIVSSAHKEVVLFFRNIHLNDPWLLLECAKIEEAEAHYEQACYYSQVLIIATQNWLLTISYVQNLHLCISLWCDGRTYISASNAMHVFIKRCYYRTLETGGSDLLVENSFSMRKQFKYS